MSKINGNTVHDAWETLWANEVKFAFENMKTVGFCVLIGMLANTAKAEEQPLFRHTNAQIEQRVEDLLGRLTLEEKIRLSHGRVNEGIAEAFKSGGIPRLNIRRRTTSDGLGGVRTFDKTETTSLPSPLSLSYTWDKDAAHTYGRLLAEETLAVHANVIFGPGMNLMRSPLGGRNLSYLGEDPYLASIMAAHYIQGAQELCVATCAKRLAANDYESHRHFTSSNKAERILQEVQMRPFELAERDGGRPLSLEPWVNQVSAVLETWYTCQATDDAIAERAARQSNSERQTQLHLWSKN